MLFAGQLQGRIAFVAPGQDEESSASYTFRMPSGIAQVMDTSQQAAAGALTTLEGLPAFDPVRLGCEGRCHGRNEDGARG